MKGYIMKRKLILCSLMLCIASSSIQIDAWPSRTSNLWPHMSNLAKKAHSYTSDNIPTNSINFLTIHLLAKAIHHLPLSNRSRTYIDCITEFLPAIAMHYRLFQSCHSMTYKDRLKQHMLFFLYANLVSYISSGIHELGHAIAATLIKHRVYSMKVYISVRSLLAHLHPGRTSSSSTITIKANNAYECYLQISKEHLKSIFHISMGPIFGIMNIYTMWRIYLHLKTLTKKVSPVDTFWTAALENAMLSHIANFIPNLIGTNSDGSLIFSHLKGLKNLYSYNLTKENAQKIIQDHQNKYFVDLYK